MAACWRELSKRRGVNLFVIALRPEPKNLTFSPDLFEQIPGKLLANEQIENREIIAKLVIEQAPHVLVLPGWRYRSYVSIAFDSRLQGVRRIMMMDNPRSHSLRQAFGKLRLRSYLRKMDFIFVAGERSWQLAKYLAIPEIKIRRGTYGIDYDLFSKCFERRRDAPLGWPRRFLFIGQYIQRKGIDLLLDAYSLYRSKVADPWPLRCCGEGVLSNILSDKPGLENVGFIQPHQLIAQMEDCGVLILPSRSDAWPIVIAEACASGLPIIATENCGSIVELVRYMYNGLTVPTGDVKGLSDALIYMHQSYHNLPAMGRRSREMAAPYAAEFWADRLLDVCKDF
jgi:glycosyltransferase involved in cell wall biosynthesis